jgi:hypothetical protein
MALLSFCCRQQCSLNGACWPLGGGVAARILPAQPGRVIIGSSTSLVPAWSLLMRESQLGCRAIKSTTGREYPPCNWPALLPPPRLRAVLSAVDMSRPASFPLPDLMAATTLDEAQAGAVAACLGRELALVQGPPGTGKGTGCGLWAACGVWCVLVRVYVGVCVCVCVCRCWHECEPRSSMAAGASSADGVAMGHALMLH